MGRASDIFKKRKYRCEGEGKHRFSEMRWESAGLPTCPECGAATHEDWGQGQGVSPALISDEIDVVIKHALFGPDGKPQRFTSMSELRRQAAAQGLVIAGETPKPSAQIQEREAAWQESVNRKYR